MPITFATETPDWVRVLFHVLKLDIHSDHPLNLEDVVLCFPNNRFSNLELLLLPNWETSANSNPEIFSNSGSFTFSVIFLSLGYWKCALLFGGLSFSEVYLELIHFLYHFFPFMFPPIFQWGCTLFITSVIFWVSCSVYDFTLGEFKVIKSFHTSRGGNKTCSFQFCILFSSDLNIFPVLIPEISIDFFRILAAS